MSTFQMIEAIENRSIWLEGFRENFWFSSLDFAEAREVR